jgi:hypothetical protein
MNQHKHRSNRDEGSALVLALVMVVLGALIVAGISNYAVTVLRANRVLSERTQRAEAVKAGLRMAFASPRDLYEYCGPDNTGTYVWVDLAPVTVNGQQVDTRCHTIDVAAAQSNDERRFGLVATRIGEQIPVELTPADPPVADPPLPPTRYNGMATATDTHAWLADTTEESLTGKIWRPRLPSHGISPRSASGTTMPSGWPTCRVFFPGTYPDPIILDGPTFFTSGVYYFESEVRVIGGADVVIGDGSTAACRNDDPSWTGPRSVSTQDALYYAERVPGEHYVNGYGATFVFGDKGRLVITNDPTERDRTNAVVGNRPISFVINRRYNQPTDLSFVPSTDVAIITVDGELVDHDNDPSTAMVGVDLDAPGRVFVPQSIVGADDPATETVNEGNLASTVDYKPSVYTPKLRAPEAPVWPSSNALQQRGSGRVLVTWAAPPFDGGTAITRYRVTASTGQTCETKGSLSCLVTGLPTSSAVTFTVEAFNRSDATDPMLEVASLPSATSASITAGSSGSVSAPSAPAAPTVSLYYGDQATTDPANSLFAHVNWAAPNANGAPITGYTVEMVPTSGGNTLTCSIDMTDSWTPEGWSEPYPRSPGDLQCDLDVPLLTGAVTEVLPEYQVRVTATNAVGSQASAQTVVPAVAVDRVDMPVQCDDPGTTTIDEHVPGDTVVDPSELAAWLTDAPLPTAACATPAFTSALVQPGVSDAAELWDHDGDGSTAPVPRHTEHVVPPRDGQPPTPIVEVDLYDDPSGAMPPVVVWIPSYVSLAQGRIKVVNPEAHDVDIVGGVMASMFDVQDGRVQFFGNGTVVPGTVKIGYEAAAIQRKLEIVSTIPGGRETSRAIVQVNQNGAYAINSWEVQ